MPKPRPQHLVVSIIMILQAVFLWALLGWAIYSLITGDFANLFSAIFLVLIVFLAVVWISNIAYGVIRLRQSAHTPALVIQLLIASIGAASFTGEFGNAAIGWLAMGPAFIAFVLLFSRPLRSMFGKD